MDLALNTTAGAVRQGCRHSGLAFLAQHAGALLVNEAPSAEAQTCVACGEIREGLVSTPSGWVCAGFRAIGQEYQHATKNVKMRFGTGKSAAWIRPGNVTVYGDVRIPSKPGLTVVPGADFSITQKVAELVLDRPEPPYLFITFGKSTGLWTGYRVTQDADRVEVCGALSLTINAARVRTLAEGLKGQDWLNVFRLSRAISSYERERTDEGMRAIDRILEAAPGLDAWQHDLPAFESDDYTALRMVMTALAERKTTDA